MKPIYSRFSKYWIAFTLMLMLAFVLGFMLTTRIAEDVIPENRTPTDTLLATALLLTYFPC
jgi:hypothetical protein